MQTENPLQNAYIGEYVEWWQPISYSYSFKNKTKTNLTEDWWSGTMNGTIDSWGLHWDWWAIWKQLDFSGASLITLTEYVNITQKSDWSSWSCRICVWVTNWVNSQYWGWASTLEASGYKWTRCEKANGSTSWNNVSLSTWEWILESVIDVTNASITTTYSRNWTVVSTSTTTLTSTDITNLLSYTYALVTTNWNGCYIQWIEVEAQ